MFRLVMSSLLACGLAVSASAQSWVSETREVATEASVTMDAVTLRVLCTRDGRFGVNAVNLKVDGVPVSGTVTFQPGRRTPIVLPFGSGLYTVSTIPMLEPFVDLIDGLRRSNNATATVGEQTVSISLQGSSAALANCPTSVADVANADLGVPGRDDSAPAVTEETTPQTAPETVEVPANPIIAVEEALAKLGYFPGQMDGQIDEALHTAIATWQRDTGRDVTGALLLEDFQALQAEAAQN